LRLDVSNLKFEFSFEGREKTKAEGIERTIGVREARQSTGAFHVVAKLLAVELACLHWIEWVDREDGHGLAWFLLLKRRN